MEVLPFLLLHLLNTLPVVLPVLAFLGLVVLVIKARNKLSVFWGLVVILVISFVFSLPIIKVREGYNSFIAACNSNPPLSELTPIDTVDGFYLLPYVYEAGMRKDHRHPLFKRGYQRKEVATQLLNTLIESARRIKLLVFKINERATLFYKPHGF